MIICMYSVCVLISSREFFISMKHIYHRGKEKERFLLIEIIK